MVVDHEQNLANAHRHSAIGVFLLKEDHAASQGACQTATQGGSEFKVKGFKLPAVSEGFECGTGFLHFRDPLQNRAGRPANASHRVTKSCTPAAKSGYGGHFAKLETVNLLDAERLGP